MCPSERVREHRGRHGPPGPPGPGRVRDGGYVTAEAAVVIPILVALAALLIWGLEAAAAQVRCVDAARAAAREAARSETPARVREAARQAAPSGAQVSVRTVDGMVRVRVTVPVPRFPVTLTAEAAALDESALDDAPAGAPAPGGAPLDGSGPAAVRPVSDSGGSPGVRAGGAGGGGEGP